ncbi:MAG: ketopantoate reductase family protein [Pseudomonadota bacterium]|nr:ketopantoate reductase family protein [Pseudomonadota bacterium]
MRFCVVGAGAMGGVYGLSLIDAGYEVDFLDVNLDHIKSVKKDGFRISGIGGQRVQKVNISAHENDFVNSADVVLFQAHTTGTKSAANSVATVLKPDGWVITLQNGIGNIEALSAVLGEERVVGGISYHSAALEDLGHVSHTNDGTTFIGELNGAISKRVKDLAEAFKKASLNPEITADILGVIWGKFVVNCGINPLCAVTGLRSGEIARNNAAAEMQTKILEEIMAVVEAKGIKLPNNDMITYVKRLTRARYNKPSMQQHIEAGRLTEIDALNGALVSEAKSLNISVPFNEALVNLVKAREFAMQQAFMDPKVDYEELERLALEEK